MVRQHRTGLRRDVAPDMFKIRPPVPEVIHQTSENKGYVYVTPPWMYEAEWAMLIAERHYAPVIIRDTMTVTDFVARSLDMQGIAWGARFSMGKTTMYQDFFESKLREYVALGQPHVLQTTSASTD